MKKRLLGVLASLLAGAGLAAAQNAATSPNGRLEIQFSTERGALVYSVRFRGHPLLDDSTIALDLDGQPSLGNNVRISQVTPSWGVDDYTPVAGKTAHVHDAYNQVTLTLAEPQPPGRTFTIEARAYNDGVAFRYVVPKQPGLESYRLRQEAIGYAIAKDASAWGLVLPNFRSPYESEYLHLTVSALNAHGSFGKPELIGLPTLMQVPGVGWMAITEAAVAGDAKMYLTSPQHGSGLESELSPLPDKSGLAVVGPLPHASAWHVILVGEAPGRLVESNLIDDLNPPSAIADTSWIHAGKASWNWWSGNVGPHDSPDTPPAPGASVLDTSKMRYYIDFAAQSGFRYMLIDAGWSKVDPNLPGKTDITQTNGHLDIASLVQYAAARNVKLWIWINHDATVAQMQTAFPLYEQWGVAGVKVDYLQEDDQPGIQFYYDVAKLAAAHHLMVDFHGATTPWGMERTYPNVLGYEATMGMEYNKWSARDTPAHRATLALTRLLSGPMDYTPGGFRNATQAGFIPRNRFPMVQGTRAQQLAMYVIDYVPIQMVPDAPSAYAGQPAFQFIKDVPAAWDETRALDGFPGQYVTIARRHGRDWYLGSITDWDPRTVTVPLSFLGSGTYTAQLYADAADAPQNPEHVALTTQTVTSSDTLTLKLAPGGGAAIRFVPQP
jgi:alpha-glucosidase